MMSRRVAAFALIAGALTGHAALAHGKAHACRNEKGQFTKCEKVKAKAKAKPCRDKKGHFAKCEKTEAKLAVQPAAKVNANPLKSDIPAATAH